MSQTTKDASLPPKALRASLPEVLIVEDEENSRRELKRVLTRNGFRVREASSNTEALQEAETGEIGVILMDVLLGDGPDGIQTAQEIQQESPTASVFFVTAYASDDRLHRRAEADVLHIAGWVEKPIRIPEIPSLIERLTSELVKVNVRGLLQESPPKDREHRLRRIAEHDPLVSSQVVADILDELHNDGAVSRPVPPESIMPSLSAQIDAAYDEMRALIVSHAGKPGLREALVPAREKLRVLQAKESELIVKRYEAHFSALHGRGQDLIRRARLLLGDE